MPESSNTSVSADHSHNVEIFRIAGKLTDPESSDAADSSDYAETSGDSDSFKWKEQFKSVTPIHTEEQTAEAVKEAPAEEEQKSTADEETVTTAAAPAEDTSDADITDQSDPDTAKEVVPSDKASSNSRSAVTKLDLGYWYIGIDEAKYAEKIRKAAYEVPFAGKGYCAAWVSYVYQAAGLGFIGGNACDMWAVCCISDNTDEIREGMLIAVKSSPMSEEGRKYGHVGIIIENPNYEGTDYHQKILELEAQNERLQKNMLETGDVRFKNFLIDKLNKNNEEITKLKEADTDQFYDVQGHLIQTDKNSNEKWLVIDAGASVSTCTLSRWITRYNVSRTVAWGWGHFVSGEIIKWTGDLPATVPFVFHEEETEEESTEEEKEEEKEKETKEETTKKPEQETTKQVETEKETSTENRETQTEPETTWAEPETTWAEPETTWAEPETTWAEPETTWAEPETTWIEPETTWIEPETTWIEPETTWVEPETPWVEPETPWVEPETPWVEPETPWVEPETPWVEPETPWVEPETTWVEPEISWVDPETEP